MLTFATDDKNQVVNAIVLSFLKEKINPAVAVRVFSPPSLVFIPLADELVLYMGMHYLIEAQARGWVPKGRTISSLRGKVFTHPDTGGRFMFTFSPSYVYVEYSKKPEIEWDIRLAERILRTGKPDPIIGKYKYVDSFQDTINYVNYKHGLDPKRRPVQISLDLETMGLWPWYADKHILTISLTKKSRQADVAYVYGSMYRKVIIEQLRWLLTSPKVKVVGANLKFDLEWIKEKFDIDCTNFVFDTLLVGSLLNENRSNSLNGHAKEYTDIGGYDDEFNAKFDKGEMELVPKEDMLSYAGGDTDAAYDVADRLRGELLQVPHLARLYVKIVHPAARVFEKVERRGMVVDREKYEALGDELTIKIAEMHKQLLDFVPANLQYKYRDNLKITRPALMQEYLFTKAGLNLKPTMFTEKAGEPSTAYEHLALLAEGSEDLAKFVDIYDRYGSATKTLSTYVIGFLKHLRPDGRFHPTYALYAGSMFGGSNDGAGTNTGRLSAKNPAVQTIPKHTIWTKRLRECFPAPPGYKFFQIDAAQGELKIAACLSNEKNMIKAYNEGRDLHTLTASGLVNVPYEEFMSWKKDETLAERFKLFRSRAKAANFGLLYGMQAAGFVAYAWASYGIKFTIAEAQAVLEAFFNTYPGLLDWHAQYKGYARKNGFIMSPLGRVRHLPLITSKSHKVASQAERQAVNSPVQGCLSDLNLYAMVGLEREFESQGLWLAGSTHDSVYGYVPENKATDMMKDMIGLCDSLPLKEEFGWDHQIPFTFDGELGDCFASLKEVSFNG